MPRIKAKSKTYRMTDMEAFILRRTKELHITQKDLAEKLGGTQASLNYRIKNGALKHSDVLTILKELQASDEDILKLMKL